MLDSTGKIASARFIDHPIFIVGGSRSGTIALLKALGHHRQILAAPTEDPFITDVGRMAMQLAFFHNHERDYYLRTLRIQEEYIYRHLRRLALESAFGPHYGLKEVTRAALRGEANPLATRYWCTKSFPGKAVAEALIELFPRVHYIWILRNGINVVHSRSKFPEFRDLPFRDHCEHWAQSIERFAYLIDMPQAVVVKQEEFADDPEAMFRRIFEQFGIPQDSGPADFALTHHVHPLADESTTKGVNVKQVLAGRRPPHEQWDDEQKGLFREICGDAMQLAGYPIEY